MGIKITNNQFLAPDGSFTPKPIDDRINENFYQSVSATLTIPILNSPSDKESLEINKLESEKIKIENKWQNAELDNRKVQLRLELAYILC